MISLILILASDSFLKKGKLLAMLNFFNCIYFDSLRRDVVSLSVTRATIMKEINVTVKSHGMSIDNRHVMLLADLMTLKVSENFWSLLYSHNGKTHLLFISIVMFSSTREKYLVLLGLVWKR